MAGIPRGETIREVGNLPVTVLLSVLMALLIYAYWDDQREDRLDNRERNKKLSELFIQMGKQSELQTTLYATKLEEMADSNRATREQTAELRRIVSALEALVGEQGAASEAQGEQPVDASPPAGLLGALP